jgi:endonuclease/exonuclease/phosphatase family metal-dependent hydrolase
MKRILAAAILAVVASAAAAEARPLKVITWNLHHGRDINGKDTVAAQAQWLATQYPDIVLLQEVEQFTGYGNFDHVASIKNALQKQTGKTYYAFWSNDFGAEYGRGAVNAILSVFPLKSVDGRRMPHDRPLTMANVEPIAGKVIALFTVHLASWEGYDGQRATQVAELIYWLTVRGSKVRLFGGDWNATPGSVPLAPVHFFYKDLYKEATAKGLFSGPSDTRPVYQSNSVVGRIDALFLGKSWPAWMKLTGMDHVNTGLSDHYAVVAEFEIQ